MPCNFRVPSFLLFITLTAVTSSPQGVAATTVCLDANCLASEAEATAQYVTGQDVAAFAVNLARAGRFSAARAALERMSPSQSRFRPTAEREISFLEYAAASWAHPNDIVVQETLDGYLSGQSGDRDQFKIASAYWLIAEKIIEKFEPSLISPDLAKLLRHKIVRRGQNATLDDLLTNRWPPAIEQLPEKKQGELWNYIAEIYTEIGNAAAAAAALDRAEQAGGYDFEGNNAVFVSTTYSWIRLGDFDRALKAARQIEPKDRRPLLKLKVGEAARAAGQKQLAHILFEEAAADFEKYPHKRGRNLNILIGIAQGYVGVGDPEAAHRIADRALELARLPNILPSSQLTDAARAYNIAGDHTRAIELLREALARMPDPDRKIGFGATIGPISGSTLGVGDSIRSSIAREFYLAGDQAAFKEQFARLSPWYQNELQNWRIEYEFGNSRLGRERILYEGLASLPADARSRVLADLAISAMVEQETSLAQTLLHRAIDNAAEAAQPMSLTLIAKAAFAGGFTDLVEKALHKAALAAHAIEGNGERAKTLAAVAATEHELLN